MSFEQLAVGAVVAALVAAFVAPLGPVAAPWKLFDPRRAGPLLALAAYCAARIVQANAVLAWRIWSPSLPIRPGMVVIPTEARTKGGLAAVGILSSTIVDNQLVDVDTRHRELQYHAVWVETADPAAARRRISGRIAALLAPMEGRSESGG